MGNEPVMKLHLKCGYCLMESEIEISDVAAACSITPCPHHGFHAQVELGVVCPKCEKENVNVCSDDPEEV